MPWQHPQHPAILEFIAGKEGKSVEEITTILNKKSGVSGLSGVSSDFRDLDAGMKDGNDRCRLALDVFCYSVKKYIGAYAAAMGGLDAIAFTAGIGENNPYVRRVSTMDLSFMGIDIDETKNEIRGEEQKISTDASKVREKDSYYSGGDSCCCNGCGILHREEKLSYL